MSVASSSSVKINILHFFYHSAVWGVSHGLFLTLFHPHVAQECFLEVQWIKMPCQLEKKKENLHSELSVIFLPCLYHGKLVKSSPSSHKLAGRFISPLTFSLEMPPGTWASALWREMTGLLLGAAEVESYSPASSPLSLFYFSLTSLSFLHHMKPFRKWWQPLKRQRPRLTSVSFTLLISISFCFFIFKIPWDNPAGSLVSGMNVYYDRWQLWHSFGLEYSEWNNYLALSINSALFLISPSSHWWMKYNGKKATIFNNRSIVVLVK